MSQPDLFGNLKGSSCGTWECQADGICYGGDLYASQASYVSTSAVYDVSGWSVRHDSYWSGTNHHYHWSI